VTGITDTTSFALAAVSLLAITLFIVMQQPWFRRLTAGPHRRRHHHRRRRRPRFRRAA
jgi:ABC-type Fe3+ transport system permease subunit